MWLAIAPSFILFLAAMYCFWQAYKNKSVKLEEEGAGAEGEPPI